MSVPTLSAKQEALNRAHLDALPDLNVAVLRNVTIEPLDVILRHGAYVEGYDAHVAFGGFDTMYQDAVGGRPEMLNGETGCVLVFMYLPRESPRLARAFATMSPQEVAEESALVVKKASAILQGIRRQTSAMILWHSFELPVHPSLGIHDARAACGQLAAVRRLNEEVGRACEAAGAAYQVDMNLCLARVGAPRFYEPRHWHRSGLPYSLDALEAIADEELKYIRPMLGRTRKCLVLDCDEVLWGGVVGEDGVSGIELGPTHPGSAYQALQLEALNLHHRGVLLALCSKNNEEDVWEVFDTHPGMLLKRSHIAAARINWHDKPSNLRRIAQDLNLGLDSLVLVDDSAFEVDLVRAAVPEVDVIHIPRRSATSASDVLAAYGGFDTLALSDEDRSRGAMYLAESARRELAAGFTDMDDYYRSLEMEVRIDVDAPEAVTRVAQQTQKTNQFNLTTRRYGEDDIHRLVKDGSAEVLSLSVRDRLGDLGRVGACILLYRGNEAIIDSFLLSCRALGRRLESVLLNAALRRARDRGADRVVGHYLRTVKNAQVERFFPGHGFREAPAEDGIDGTFVFETARRIPEDPGFFKSIITR